MTSPWGLIAGSSIVAASVIGLPSLVLIPLVIGLMSVVSGHGNWRHIVVSFAAVAVVLWRISTIYVTGMIPDLDLSTGAIGVITDIPQPSSAGQQVVLQLETLEFEGEAAVPADGEVMIWLRAPRPLEHGERIQVAWTMESSTVLAPGFGRWVESQGAQGAGFAHQVRVVDPSSSPIRYLGRLRTRINSRLQRLIPGDAGALAMGIVTGDDARLSDKAANDFLRTGTSHVTAVSGSNMSMMVALWSAVIVNRRLKRWFLIQAGIVSSLWGYALLVGAEPPALRAAIVATLVLVAVRFGRAPDPLTLLMVASGGMLLWQPAMADSVSFWLSVTASFAFVTVMPPTTDSWTARTVFRTSIHGILLANVVTLPIVVLVFGTWSPIGILANLLIAPMISIVFPLTFLLALVALVSMPVAGLIAWIPGFVLDVVLSLLGYLGRAASPVALGANGRVTALLIAIPCLAITFAMSRDAHRWIQIVAQGWRTERGVVAIACVGPAMGLGIALLAQAVKWFYE